MLPLHLAALALGGASEPPRTRVVLMGSTGNLAGKYLWQAIFHMYCKNGGPAAPVQLDVVAAARDTRDKAWPKVQAFLDEKVHCPKQAGVQCDEGTLAAFRASVSFAQLKRDEHYAALCGGWTGDEAGRLFYLSVPPFAYDSISKSIKAHCQPPDAAAFLRVAFEKPFGSDTESAVQMAQQFKATLAEEEIYRVDHYLGKAGVQQITEFRVAQQRAGGLTGGLWSGAHIRRVEVYMKEKEDCAGRTKFYDEYGVVRDVHQNHLTEVMALVGAPMEDGRAQSPAEALEAKAQFLASFAPVAPDHIWGGQYEGYGEHVRQDFEDPAKTSAMSTFAAAHLESQSPQWRGTHWYIAGGKQQDERRAYVRLQFAADAGGEDDLSVLFHIQGGSAAQSAFGPVTCVGKALLPERPELVAEGLPHWRLLESDAAAAAFGYAHCWAVGPLPDRPYDRLLWEMYRGNQDSFVGTEGLLAAWAVWNDALEPSPHAYAPGHHSEDTVQQLVRRLEPPKGHAEL